MNYTAARMLFEEQISPRVNKARDEKGDYESPLVAEAWHWYLKGYKANATTTCHLLHELNTLLLKGEIESTTPVTELILLLLGKL